MNVLWVRWIVCCALLLPALPAVALESSLEVAVGYNDNVFSDAEAAGSSFAQGELAVEALLCEGERWRLFGYSEGRYRDYLRFDPQWQALCGLAAQRRFLNGAVHGTFFAELERYRDDEIAEDENDSVQLSPRLKWFIDERISLAVQIDYQASRYRQQPAAARGAASQQTPAPLPPGGATGGAANGVAGGAAPSSPPRDRHDRLQQLLVTLNYRWSADWQSDVSALASHNDSTLRREDYEEVLVEKRWIYTPAARWSAEFWAARRWRDYRDDSEQRWQLGVQLNGDYPLLPPIYMRVEKLWNDSSFSADNYSEMVSQCGFSWVF